MTFEERLQKAIERGRRRSEAQAQADAARELSEKELRRLHMQYRLQLSEQIDTTLREVVDRIPGFRLEGLANEGGWGSAISRDDLELRIPGQRRSLFSRLELLIRPFSEARVLDLAVKATVRNKEVFRRDHYHPLSDVDLTAFEEVIDLWVLEFAETYASGR
jgi:hypothetical protein